MNREGAYRSLLPPANRSPRPSSQRERLSRTRQRWRRMSILTELERAGCRFEGRVQRAHRALANALDVLDTELSE